MEKKIFYSVGNKADEDYAGVDVNFDEERRNKISNCIYELEKVYSEKGKDYDYLKNSVEDNHRRNEAITRYKHTLEELNKMLDEANEYVRNKPIKKEIEIVTNYKLMQGTAPKMVMLGEDFAKPVNTWSQVLNTVCDRMAQIYGEEFETILESEEFRGRKRSYFSKDKSELYSARKIEKSSYFCECNSSTDILIKICYKLLSKLEFKGEFAVEIK